MENPIIKAWKGMYKSFHKMFNGDREIDNDLDNLYLSKKIFNANEVYEYEVIFKSKDIDEIKNKMIDMILEGNKSEDLIVLSRVGLNIDIDIEEIKEEEDLECPLNFDLNSFIKDRDEILKERNYYKDLYERHRDSVDSGH